MRGVPYFLLLFPLAAHAEGPMSAEAFDAATLGKTIVYGTPEGEYGAEEYFDGRRVRWSFFDGDCVEGQWYMRGPAICFAYNGYPDPHCWLFFDGGVSMTAQFLDPDGDPGPLVALSTSPEPLYCKGPKVGV